MQELIAALTEAMKTELTVSRAAKAAMETFEALERERGEVTARVRQLRGELIAEVAAAAGCSEEGITWYREHTL